jgi:hypothetical protein
MFLGLLGNYLAPVIVEDRLSYALNHIAFMIHGARK